MIRISPLVAQFSLQIDFVGIPCCKIGTQWSFDLKLRSRKHQKKTQFPATAELGYRFAFQSDSPLKTVKISCRTLYIRHPVTHLKLLSFNFRRGFRNFILSGEKFRLQDSMVKRISLIGRCYLKVEGVLWSPRCKQKKCLSRPREADMAISDWKETYENLGMILRQESSATFRR